MLNLRHIEVFYAIMRTGSITEAARVLNVTQPAVSAALKQLETRLAMPLFDRTGGRLRATPEAKALLPDVAEIFGRLGAVERLSRDLAQGARGVLAVAATPPLCDGYVAKAVATFLVQRPGVEFAVHAIPSATALDRVINHEVDLSVVYEPVVSSAVRVDLLGRAAIGCILPARHALARRPAIRAQDLARYPVITYLPQALLRPYIDRAVGSLRTPLNAVVRTTTSATAITLAVNGAGIALTETALFAARPIPGFVMRPIEPHVELKILLLTPHRPTPSRVAAEFVQHLRGVFP